MEVIELVNAGSTVGLEPTFIDYGATRISGYHPYASGEWRAGAWTYMSDREVERQCQLNGSGKCKHMGSRSCNGG